MLYSQNLQKQTPPNFSNQEAHAWGTGPASAFESHYICIPTVKATIVQYAMMSNFPFSKLLQWILVITLMVYQVILFFTLETQNTKPISYIPLMFHFAHVLMYS